MSYLGGKEPVRAFLVTLLVICILGIYKCDMQYGSVGVQSVISSNFLSIDEFAIVRILCGLVVWTTVIHMLADPKGLTIQVMTPYGTSKALHVVGISRFTAFTQWSWALQGLYFGLCTIIWFLNKHYPMVLIDKSYGIAPFVNPICFGLWLIYELSVTMSFIVSSLVTFVLIPQAKRKGLPIDNYYRPLTLLMHNMNVLFMTIELGLNSFHFVMSHIFVPALWGFAYIRFAWWWYERKGVFFYFFLDYHHPKAVLMHLGLITLMSCYFAICAFVAKYIQSKASSDHAQYWPWYVLLAFSAFCTKWPNGKEWSIFTNAIRDTWNGIPYTQAPPSKRAIAASKATATLREPRASKTASSETAGKSKNTARSRSKSTDNKVSQGRSRSRSRSKSRSTSKSRKAPVH